MIDGMRHCNEHVNIGLLRKLYSSNCVEFPWDLKEERHGHEQNIEPERANYGGMAK